MFDSQLVQTSAINIAGFLLALGTSVLIARALGPAGLGAFQLALQAGSVLSVIVLLGADHRALKTKSNANANLVCDNSYDEVMSAAIIRAVLFFLLSLPLLLVVISSKACAQENLLLLVGIVSFYVPLQTFLELSYARLKIEFRVFELGLLRDIGRPLLTGIAMLTILEFYPQASAGLVLLVVGLVVLILLFIALQKLASSNLTKFRFNLQAAWTDATAEIWHLTIGALCYPLVLSILLAMLGQWSRFSDAGVFAVVCSLASVSLVPLNMTNQTSIQIFSGFRGDPTSLKSTFAKLRNRTALGGIPIALGLIMASQTLLLIWGSDFEAGAATLSILSFIYALSMLAGSAGNLLISQDSSFQHFLGNLIFVGTALILGLILIPIYGLTGAGLALGIAHLAQRSYWRFRISTYFEAETLV